MLKKVMKYEMRGSARQLLPLYGGSLVVALLLRALYWVAGLLHPTAGQVVGALSGILCVFIIIGLCVVPFAMLVVRFFHGTVGNEAYQTFALPVKTGTHIYGRLWVGTLLSSLGFVVAFVCALLMFPGAATQLRTELFAPESWDGQVLSTGAKWGITICVVVLLILCIATVLLRFYASIGLGTAIGTNRVVGGIIAYFVLNFVESFAALALALPFFFYFGASYERIQAVQAALANPLHLALVAIAGVTVLLLLMNVANYLITRYYFTKKLNLQ